MICDSLIEGAEQNGNQVTKIHLGKLNISGCTGCDYCLAHNGQCSIRDDMDIVYPALDQADVIVFASPIYFFSMSAQLKAVIDRFYPRAYTGYHCKQSIFLTVCGDSNASVMDPAIASYKMIVDYMGCEDIGIIGVTNVNGKGDILNHPSLEKARLLGTTIK